MINILEVKNIRQEAHFINEREFNIQLLEVFSGERAGSASERKKLGTIRRRIGDKIYIEAINLLTNKVIPDEKKPERSLMISKPTKGCWLSSFSAASAFRLPRWIICSTS